MKKEDLEKLLADHNEIVFARITPMHKIEVVETLQRKGEVVAVTGDSQEDSEAMVKADIGKVICSYEIYRYISCFKSNYEFGNKT